MTIEIIGTRNYSATVIRVPELRKAQNSDRLYIIDKLGMTAIVDASWLDKVGELALIFPAEVQIAHDILERNNLYTDPELNSNREKGYVGKNRRVRAIKLRGTISNALVLPTTALGFRSFHHTWEEGQVFDTFDGTEVCRKYVVETKSAGLTRGEQQVKKAFKRVDETFLPMHFETGQWEREKQNVAESTELIITQKLHGTSVRLANTVVKRQLTWIEKLAQKLGIAVRDHDYDLVAGSRKVIKDPNNPRQDHYYKKDVYTEALLEYGDVIPKNHVIYGELVGFVGDGEGAAKPLQAGHTYEAIADSPDPRKRTQLYVYRVAIVTEDGELIDLSWNQVKAFCVRHGLQNVPELTRSSKETFFVDEFTELDFWKGHQASVARGFTGYTDTPVKLSAGGTGKDEGVVIRDESGMVPVFYKFKNPSHYLYETAQLDAGVEAS